MRGECATHAIMTYLQWGHILALHQMFSLIHCLVVVVHFKIHPMESKTKWKRARKKAQNTNNENDKFRWTVQCSISNSVFNALCVCLQSFFSRWHHSFSRFFFPGFVFTIFIFFIHSFIHVSRTKTVEGRDTETGRKREGGRNA